MPSSSSTVLHIPEAEDQTIETRDSSAAPAADDDEDYWMLILLKYLHHLLHCLEPVKLHMQFTAVVS